MKRAVDLSTEDKKPAEKRIFSGWHWDALLLLVLSAAAYFRFTGLLWGEFSYLHPDERFLVWVTADLSPVRSLAEYFNTAVSTLNPHNVGHGFFVYGNFPIILTRYLVEWVYGGGGWESALVIGRVLSASFDLITVFLVYLIGARLFNRWVGILGAAFSAAAVMQIQQAHFYTSDSFATTFSTLALFFAVSLSMNQDKPADEQHLHRWSTWLRSRAFTTSLMFGAAVGLAMACKINTAPVALLLPAAWVIRWLRIRKDSPAISTWAVLATLIAAGLTALIVFRIFQPYAFRGPSFFDVLPNQQWLQNLRALAIQSGGNVDFPPALQWARRPITFSWQNMVQWGMGWPMGLLAWAGFLWMGWRLIKGDWRASLLWGWTAIYFTWQSLVHNPTMRYQLPVYPALAVMAGWALVQLWQRARSHTALTKPKPRTISSILVIILGAAALVGTQAWAFAFTRIYTRPVTRVEATRWMYQNIPAAVNLSIQTEDGWYVQPLSYEPEFVISRAANLQMAFTASFDGVLSRIDFESIQDRSLMEDYKTLVLSVSEVGDGGSIVGFGTTTQQFTPSDNEIRQIWLDNPLAVEKGRTYHIILSMLGGEGGLSVSRKVKAVINGPEQEYKQSLPPVVGVIRADRFQDIRFTASKTGSLEEIRLNRVIDTWLDPGEKTLKVSVLANPGQGEAISSGQAVSRFNFFENDLRGEPAVIRIDPPVNLVKGETYVLRLDLAQGNGALAIHSSAIANESTWDDGLPLRLGSYDPYSGMYPRDLTFEMYWDDNQAKREWFSSILERSDFIIISSSRQWGTTTRLPERYPLTSAYYRNLIGCPPEKEILWCYRVAEPGMFFGNLGFDLVKVFTSYPNLGSLTFNTQFAEEAFSVYDHPKVFIFQKSADYDQSRVERILNAIDLTNVQRIIPGQAPDHPADLMLPDYRLAQQQAGGTWRELFNTEAVQNRWPGVGMLIWYMVITLLGWMVYPLVRAALFGLPDRGFPLVKIAALLLISWLVWIAASMQMSFSRQVITLVVVLLLVVNTSLAFWQRRGLRKEIQERWRYMLMVEAVSAALFFLFILIRIGNPDLWHPAFGGEKPMDFAYFNAVLKSTTFPPYNPWFSGAYINYYYYGFVLAAVPVKWLGIVPAIAYNLVLPIMAAMLGLGAFSAGWNLTAALKENRGEITSVTERVPIDRLALSTGLLAAVGSLIIGNLGTLRMIWHGIMRLVAPGGSIEGSNFFERLSWTVQGISRFVGGERLPFSTGDWYWIPSRALPGEAITEFPFFTFLYGDPHAHLFALPLTMLALGWCLAILFGKWRWRIDQNSSSALPMLLTFFLGALAMGVLRPTNTWDMPTYLALGLTAVGYTVFKHAPAWQKDGLQIPIWLGKALKAALAGAILVMGSFILFQPYAQWYAQGYTSIDLWQGMRSPLASYLTHWGIFFFFIISWMVAETVDWMAKTPLSSLKRLRKYTTWIYLAMALYLVAVLYLGLAARVEIGWFALTLAIWCLVLILRPGLPAAKRAVLFMVGSAVILTLAVELVVLVGDIGRMNTVFKFYLQAWNLLAVSSAAAAIWLLPEIARHWQSGWAKGWRIAAVVLVASGLLYPLLAGSAKIRDRMSSSAPHGLDGMAFMLTSQYHDQGQVMQLDQDYRAIRWLQENIDGSPVIVEGNAPLYRWGSRMSIYTGLPTVIGWDWHQRQQRAGSTDAPVYTRIADVAEFYNSLERQTARNFLDRYGVKYIVVGQLERIYHDPQGIAKFELLDGDLWREVYRDQDTVIYEVIS